VVVSESRRKPGFRAAPRRRIGPRSVIAGRRSDCAAGLNHIELLSVGKDGVAAALNALERKSEKCNGSSAGKSSSRSAARVFQPKKTRDKFTNRFQGR